MHPLKFSLGLLPPFRFPVRVVALVVIFGWTLLPCPVTDATVSLIGGLIELQFGPIHRRGIIEYT